MGNRFQRKVVPEAGLEPATDGDIARKYLRFPFLIESKFHPLPQTHTHERLYR
jgi:hypothetical protein